MSNSISLTASMRSNLLSLQNIAGQVDLTQNRLSTGLKVNSAIDNPSSYYTAVSLNNRASDLSALLDSMAQGIQTIKAATEGLEAGAKLLEQASATATQALETVNVPAKSWFEEQEGVAAVVSSKEELLAAIDSGRKGDIVIYGQIDMGNTGIVLKEGQNLIGIGYYGIADNGENKFSQLSFDVSQGSSHAIEVKEQNLLADFTLKTKLNQTTSAVYANSRDKNVVYVHHMNFVAETVDSKDRGFVLQGAAFEFSGVSKISATGNRSITNFGNAKVHLSGDAQLTVVSSGQNTWNTHVVLDGLSKFNIQGCGWLNATSGFTLNDRSTVNIVSDPTHTGDTLAFYASRTYVNDSATLNVSIKAGTAFYDNKTYLNSVKAQINLKASGFTYAEKEGATLFQAVAGLQLGFNGAKYQTDQAIDFVIGNAYQSYFPDEFYEIGQIALPEIDFAVSEMPEENGKEDQETSKYTGQYNEILKQYDSLIKDSSYKGINLLREQNLTVTFNENRSAQLSVQGKDASAKALGLGVGDWKNQGDIAQSLAEIAAALSQIRQMSSELGNYYSIVTTRENFTQNLINVLTEGADKLTLADMNEESANMLALQTRQQLAVNSLSLASQASQSILKLF